MNDALLSSKKHDWATPQELFDKLNAEFGFTLDAAASPHNAKCERYWTFEDNALHQRWEGVVWLNPPYGRDIKKWIAKAHTEAQKGATVVCLVPARTDAEFFQRMAFEHAAEIRFIKGRIKFMGAKDPAPFPTMLLIFKPESESVKVTTYNMKAA